MIFVDSSVVGNIQEDIKFKVEYIADTGSEYTLSQVTIKKPDTLLPENVKKDINIAGIIGTADSSSVTISRYLMGTGYILNINTNGE